MEGPAPTLDDCLQVLDQFLAGRVHHDLMMAIVSQGVAGSAAAGHAVREHIDVALRAGELSEPVWESICAEVERALANDAPTEWPEDEVIASQTTEMLADSIMAATLPNLAIPPPRPAEPVDTGTATRPEPAATSLRPGTLLGERYVIVSRANRGGMGDVYKALDRSKKEADEPDPWVAIKVIGKDFARHPQALAALQQEAENCRALTHDNIVRVYDFERHGASCFITMEWLEGQSLVEILGRARQKPLNTTQLRRIIVSTGAALAYAHLNGITHADVKPGNVFVTRDGAVKLLDFGAARALAGKQGPTVAAKTPAYASCEVLEGQTPEPSDDVFSYALLIYRLLAGERAFGQSNALAAEAAGLRPQRVTSLAEHAWTVLLQGLAFRRADRPANVASFLEDFTAPPRHKSQPVAAPTSDAPRADREKPLPEPPVSPPPTAEPVFAEPAPAAAADNDSIPAEYGNLVAADAGGVSAVEPAGPESDRPGWKRSAVIGATVVACAGVAWWFWAGESAPAPAATAVQPAPARHILPAQPPSENPSPVAGFAQDTADVSPGELDAADAAVPAETAEPELDELPRPDAQLASVAAAPTVSRPTRKPGRSATLAAAPPAVKPRPADQATPAPEPEPAAAEASRATGAMADTVPAAASEPVAAPARSSATEGPTTADPISQGTAGAGASISAPAASEPAGLPGDYGPTLPTVGPREVAMSELEFARYVEPRYPRSRAARRTAGWAEVAFQVGPDGKPNDVRIAESSPPEVFDEAAVDAVSRWRFKPFVAGGEAVAVATVVRLRFQP